MLPAEDSPALKPLLTEGSLTTPDHYMMARQRVWTAWLQKDGQTVHTPEWTWQETQYFTPLLRTAYNQKPANSLFLFLILSFFFLDKGFLCIKS